MLVPKLWNRHTRTTVSSGMITIACIPTVPTTYRLSTSRYGDKTSGITPRPPTAENASNLEKNPFGPLAKSILLSANETFGPKENYQRPPESKVPPSLSALNKQLMNVHMENPILVEAIHQHVLLTSFIAAEEANEDVDVQSVEFEHYGDELYIGGNEEASLEIQAQ